MQVMLPSILLKISKSQLLFQPGWLSLSSMETMILTM